MTTRTLGLCILLLTTFAAAAQQPALQPLGQHPCGHRHQPRCPPPPPPPVTLTITFVPAAPSIPDSSPIGTPIAQIVVTLGDGSTFSGSLGFGLPYGSGNGVCAIAGSTLVLGTPNPPDGTTNCTVTATQ